MPKPASEDLPTTEVSPDPSLEKRTRREFTTEYKLRVIAEADQCVRGELGALLRREKLYHSQLQQWRRELANDGESRLSKTRPGPRPAQTAAEKELAKLKRENARLTRKLEIAEGCIELQKKLSHLLEQADSENSS